MNGGIDWLQLIKIIADVILLPAFGMLWSIQGRLSKIEGIISTLLERQNESTGFSSNRVPRRARRDFAASDNRP